ncbi:MAG TPA: 4-hydroxy-tetrahydrodipicolinate synthase [Terriglobales bacterium]|nr:4-hydroxy-tetrahydrodipicolinate synthase [Terriglobales bacterium]
MMSLDKSFLRGSYSPVMTPFRHGEVDLENFAALLERQVRQGSHGILVTGTTGEPSSLTFEERAQLVTIAVAAVKGRIPVVAASGSQSLADTLALTAQAEKAGADAVLVVTPYYIKPSQQGLLEYFAAVGQHTSLPLMIYHIPGRAAVTVTCETVARIADRVPNLVGIKHAATDLDLVTELLTKLGPEFRIFCGLEALSLPMLSIGACGLMNAVGNLAPARVAALYDAVQRGDLPAARRLHFELFELNRAIFLDTNPIPLKYMMWRMGLLATPELRLPLVPLDSERSKVLDGVLLRSGLLQTAASV